MTSARARARSISQNVSRSQWYLRTINLAKTIHIHARTLIVVIAYRRFSHPHSRGGSLIGKSVASRLIRDKTFQKLYSLFEASLYNICRMTNSRIFTNRGKRIYFVRKFNAKSASRKFPEFRVPLDLAFSSQPLSL